MNLRDRIFATSDPVAGSRILSERILRLDCSWCDRVIREGSGPVSHGICPDCLARELAA